MWHAVQDCVVGDFVALVYLIEGQEAESGNMKAIVKSDEKGGLGDL